MHKSASFQAEIRHKICVPFFFFHSILDFGPIFKNISNYSIFLSVEIMAKKGTVLPVKDWRMQKHVGKILYLMRHMLKVVIFRTITLPTSRTSCSYVIFCERLLIKQLLCTTFIWSQSLEKNPVLKHQNPIVFP